jgi:hypothetical protein
MGSRILILLSPLFTALYLNNLAVPLALCPLHLASSLLFGRILYLHPLPEGDIGCPSLIRLATVVVVVEVLEVVEGDLALKLPDETAAIHLL